MFRHVRTHAAVVNGVQAFEKKSRGETEERNCVGYDGY